MVMVLMDMMVKTEEVEKMFNGDTLKTLAHGTVGIGVWWLEFIPDFLQYITAILKWDGDTPSCFDGMTTYNHSEILTELAKSSWNDEG